MDNDQAFLAPDASGQRYRTPCPAFVAAWRQRAFLAGASRRVDRQYRRRRPLSAPGSGERLAQAPSSQVVPVRAEAAATSASPGNRRRAQALQGSPARQSCSSKVGKVFTAMRRSRDKAVC